MSALSAFFIGILSSLATIFIVFLCRTQIFFIINIIFYKIYPKISGQWKLELIEASNSLLNQRDIVLLSQFGSTITGLIKTYDGDKIIANDLIKGKITPTRLLLYTYESKTADHNCFGSALFKINSTAEKMYGYVTYICEKCEKSSASKAILTKIS